MTVSEVFTAALSSLGPMLLNVAAAGIGVGAVVLLLTTGWRLFLQLSDGGAEADDSYGYAEDDDEGDYDSPSWSDMAAEEWEIEEREERRRSWS